MAAKTLTLEVITQERRILEVPADQVTVMTSTGELTILPGHISLFSRLSPGILRYTHDKKENFLAVFGGFMDVSVADRVTILADAADRAEDLDIASVEAAKAKAEKTLEGQFEAPEDFVRAETALRLTNLRLKAARLNRSGAIQKQL